MRRQIAQSKIGNRGTWGQRKTNSSQAQQTGGKMQERPNEGIRPNESTKPNDDSMQSDKEQRYQAGEKVKDQRAEATRGQ